MTWVSVLREHEALFHRAPSAHNTQPWTVDYRDDEIRIGANPARSLPVSDPTGRDLGLGLGAFAETVLIVASSLGLPVALTPDLRLVPASACYPTPYTAADVAGRRVARGRYVPGSLDPAVLAGLEPGLVALPARSLAADLMAADRWMFGTPPVALELREWLRLHPSHPRYAEDGLSDRALELGAAEALFLRGALRVYPAARRVGLARVLAASGSGLLKYDGTVLVLTSSSGAGVPQLGATGADPGGPGEVAPGSGAAVRPDLVEAGRRLMRTWLALARHGLAVHPLSQLIDCPETAGRLADRIGTTPLAVFRVGRPESEPVRSARRVAG